MVLVSRHFGETRMGRKIQLFYEHDEVYLPDTMRDFSAHNHFDAFALFEFLLIEAYRRAVDDPQEYQQLVEMHEFHGGELSESFIAEEKEKLGIITSIDFCNYGKSRLRAIFQK